MVLIRALGTARDLGRLHEIVAVLVRHGLGDLVRRLGLVSALEKAGRAVRWEVPEGLGSKPTERHVREALEDLGPTFVKVGQMLAARSDLLPEAWTDELARLHEQAAAVPFDEIRAQLTEDLGAPPEEVFDELDESPLAAASIAQVHTARLADGTAVVLKVRRPGAREKAEADMRLLQRLAEAAEREVPELRRYRPRSLVRQFSSSLMHELDLTIEARSAERVAENMAEHPATAVTVVVPRIHGRWSCERLCVMDRLEGTSVAEWLRAGRPGEVDGATVARQGADAVLSMVFEDGFYHADPHPGNVLLLPDGRLGLLDFGMVGHLSMTRRTEFLELLMGVVGADAEQVAEILVTWGHDGVVDETALTQDCAAFVDRYHGTPLQQLQAGAVLRDIAAVLRDHDLVLPNDVAMLLKVFVTLEGLGRELDPDFVVSAHVEPFARRLLRRAHSPWVIGMRVSRELARLAGTLPEDLRRLRTLVRRGRLGVDVGLGDLEGFGARLSSAANRVTIGMITAALIVGTSISLTIPGGPRLWGLPVFGLFGFVSSVVVGLWLLWSIARSTRR